MYLLSSSYGNDSCALMVWAYLAKLKDVHVIFVDTGWSGNGWLERVKRLETWASGGLGFTVHHEKSTMGFEELVRTKKGFPSQRYQWCSGILKGLPFLNIADELDPSAEAVVMIGKRRAESPDRAETPEFIFDSEYHGGRPVWNPLCRYTDGERNDLLALAKLDVLPHRSQECAPCVNANKRDLQMLTSDEISRVKNLETEIGKTMFRPAKKMGATGIEQVIVWANSSRGKYEPADNFECSGGYCGY